MKDERVDMELVEEERSHGVRIYWASSYYRTILREQDELIVKQRHQIEKLQRTYKDETKATKARAYEAEQALAVIRKVCRHYGWKEQQDGVSGLKVLAEKLGVWLTERFQQAAQVKQTLRDAGLRSARGNEEHDAEWLAWEERKRDGEVFAEQQEQLLRKDD